jgi:hypothetical protein
VHDLAIEGTIGGDVIGNSVLGICREAAREKEECKKDGSHRKDIDQLKGS